ncbi:MAG: hypothetical protein LBK66_15335 [Spirochaetaceae bacterium]|jgi:hypothetical protein|nr:hypothetical protein [Spirochaetaceae bacterium]
MRLKNILTAGAFLLLLSAGLYAQGNAPLWVTNKNAAFSERDWVCTVEQRNTRAEAQSAAAATLALAFKMDVKSVSSAMQSFSQIASGGGQLSRDSSLKQQVDTSSDVAGLMGVVNDFWNAPDGSWYAAARMNRRDGAAAYSTIMKQNAGIITGLIQEAADEGATFGAYESLAFAYNLATLNDNYMNIVSVLDNSTAQGLRFSYGNAAAVRTLMQKAAGDIVITVEVSGDEQGALAKAFSSVFSSRKFKTSSTASEPAYTLYAEYSRSPEAPVANTFRMRYLINAVLSDKDGEEVLSFTENKRVTSTTETQAAARAVRDTEKSITETGFAKSFDQYLESLGAVQK